MREVILIIHNERYLMKKNLYFGSLILALMSASVSIAGPLTLKTAVFGKTGTTPPILLGYFSNWDIYNENLSTTPKKDFIFNSKQNLYKLARLNTVAYAFFEAAPDGTIQSSDPWSDFDSTDKNFCEANPVICFPKESKSVIGGFGNFNQFAKSGETSGITNRLIAFGGATHDMEVQFALNNPDKFVESLNVLKKAYNFTGLDIDYEPANGVPQENKAKLITLMKKVREVMGKDFMITYTIIPNQEHIDDFGPGNWYEVEKTVDYINVMNYDIFGAWQDKTGIQSGLYSVPNTGGSNKFYADIVIARLIVNGVPANKIVLGYPSYGKTVSGVAGDGLGQPFTSRYLGNMDEPICVAKNDCSGNMSYSKIIADNLPIKHQIQQDVINGAYSNFAAGSNGTGKAFSTFDDAASINAKVNYAKSKNLAGVMTWGINYDAPAINADGSSNAASLLNAVNSAYGIIPRHVTPPPVGPYFILQVSNISPDETGGFAGATLVVNGYYAFGNVEKKPISPGFNQPWATAASAQPPGIIESEDLNNFFKNGAQSFTTSQILVNGYDNNGSIYDPKVKQVECQLGKNFTFHAGKAYNLMVNALPKPGWPNCDIKEM
jgi:GH18 family chitinase